jgi:hypothetical protein
MCCVVCPGHGYCESCPGFMWPLSAVWILFAFNGQAIPVLTFVGTGIFLWSEVGHGKGEVMLSSAGWRVSVCLVLAMGAVAMAGSFASEVVNYTPGEGANPYYGSGEAALGEPSRYIPDGGWPSVVSIFNSPWLPAQIVSLGQGGSLTVQFDQPITNDPNHQFGVDLMVFGNSTFWDMAYPAGEFGSTATLFSVGAGKIEVSENGVDFFEIPNVLADQLFPTQGYLDVGPQDSIPGQQPTDFFKPVNPALTLSDFDGLTYQQALALYDGSGGGTPIDLASAVDALGAPAGLTEAHYVRISHMGEGATEIDALVAVPEPAMGLTLVLLAGGIALRGRMRSRRGC